MCNRYRAIGLEELTHYAREEFGITWDLLTPRYNIAPNQVAPVFVRDESGQAVATVARWNLIPHFERTDRPGYLRTNARSEEVLAKPSYREPIQKRRCLVPADGFYEWEHLHGGRLKLPWAFELKGARPFSFAGLWEHGGADRPPSFTILTTRPNELVARIHDRMPVMLAAAQAHQWLAPGPLTKETLAPFVEPFPPGEMHSYPVNPRLNSVREDSATVAAPVSPDDYARERQAASSQGELF
jgi:putative SOS response-associated peptidase YedK